MRTMWPTRPGSGRRRGMLLLLVLSMLTLFMLMGALAVVIATRARASARAFSNAGSGSGAAAMIAETMTDEALLTLIRGSKDPAVNALLSNDSLLKDMYGTQGKGAFVEEAYDAFDDQNRFLTQTTLDASGRVASVPRPAFGTTGAPCQVDNDSDGVADSIWLSGLLQPLTLADGKTLSFRVSYLVLDLDGRINVNAHGRRADMPPSATGAVGPADVDASPLLTSAVWNLLMERTGGQLLSGSISPSEQWRPLPPISSPVDGRFGNLNTTNTYEVRLDLEARRPASLKNATNQNPFTLGELERVLRQFDADASTLPPRLTGILHDRAERARMRITTDSWETPGDRTDISWVAPNSGRPEEQAFFNSLCQKIAAQLYPKWNSPGDPQRAAHLAKLQEVEQWVANIVEFRDKDNSNPQLDRLTSGKVTGVEPNELANLNPPLDIPGGPVGWNQGQFLSYAQVLGVPKGNLSEIAARRNNTSPPMNTSLAIDTPELLEFLMVPTLFVKTYWDEEKYFGPGDPANVVRLPKREPGRINVNTCHPEVWTFLLGQSQDNPFDNNPNSAAKNAGLLLRSPLVFGGDANYKAESINHAVANRLANVATVRSHVFAVWITLEVKNSDTPDQPTYHRLFAIVDRSLPVNFTAATEGQTTSEVRSTIRLQRFLN
jgi:hypothetical protein